MTTNKQAYNAFGGSDGTPPPPPTFHCQHCGCRLVKSSLVWSKDGWKRRWICPRHRDGTGCGRTTMHPKE